MQMSQMPGQGMQMMGGPPQGMSQMPGGGGGMPGQMQGQIGGGRLPLNTVDLDPKTSLNQFCQRYCSRPVTKADILYATTTFAPNQFQTIVKLNCMEGQEYAGHVCTNAKDAEKSAADQALSAYASVIAALPPVPGGAPKKKKPANPAGANRGLTGQLPTALPGAAATGDNPALTDKVKLNSLCMKIAGRALSKGDTSYDTRQVGLGKTPTGFQSTVRLPCLPGDWANQAWMGQVFANKQGAEQSAAVTALSAIQADPQLSAIIEEAKNKPVKGAKGKGEGGGWTFVNGPDLERERLTQAPITGTVIEWKKNFGWIRASAPIEHDAAKRRGGKVYVHQQDLQGGLQELQPETVVQFHLYVDQSGLGAEEVMA